MMRPPAVPGIPIGFSGVMPGPSQSPLPPWNGMRTGGSPTMKPSTASPKSPAQPLRRNSPSV